MSNVTLERVQELKEKMVMGLIGQLCTPDVDREVDNFLVSNKFQILDILDDALYAHKQGKI